MSSIVRALCVMAAVLVLVPGALAAQTPEQQIERALQRAMQVGVPVQLLESKVAEGKAKGYPLARIAQAVEKRLEVLQRVQTRLGARAQLTTEELGVAADAAQSGVSDAVLLTIASRAPRERRAVALDAVRQLVQLGNTPEEALQRVTEAMQRGPEALMNLPAQAAAARAAHGGGPPQGATGPASSQGRGGPPAGVPPGKTKPPKTGGGG